MPDETPCYRRWLEDHRKAAIERGGVSLPWVPSGRYTGIVEGPQGREWAADLAECITIAKLAKKLSDRDGDIVTRRALAANLKRLGLLHDLLEWKEVPMIVDPQETKPEYSHRARLTPWALEQGFGVTIATSSRTGNGKRLEMDLITPAGQQFVMDSIETKTAEVKPVKTSARVEEIVSMEPQVSRREIARRLGISRQAVQQHLKKLAA